MLLELAFLENLVIMTRPSPMPRGTCSTCHAPDSSSHELPSIVADDMH
jgi:hypothetical protein